MMVEIHKLNHKQGKNDLQDSHESILEILEDGIDKNGPPRATLAKRAKSYSDFYEVCNFYFGRSAPTDAPADVLETSKDFGSDALFGGNYEQYENEILGASQEEYQYAEEDYCLDGTC